MERVLRTSTPAAFIACAYEECVALPMVVPMAMENAAGSLRMRSRNSRASLIGESDRTTIATYSTASTANGVKSV